MIGCDGGSGQESGDWGQESGDGGQESGDKGQESIGGAGDLTPDA